MVPGNLRGDAHVNGFTERYDLSRQTIAVDVTTCCEFYLYLLSYILFFLSRLLILNFLSA